MNFVKVTKTKIVYQKSQRYLTKSTNKKQKSLLTFIQYCAVQFTALNDSLNM